MHFDEEMGFQFLCPRSTVLSPSDPRPPTVVGGQCQAGWMGGYQWLRLSVREAGESRRDLRRLGLQAERVKFVPNGYRSVY